jgi:hypothetical protein
MALASATGREQPFAGESPVRLRRGAAAERKGFAPLVARALFVCTALGAAVAANVLALGDGIEPARVASRQLVYAATKVKAQIGPIADAARAAFPRDMLARVEGAFSSVDRVPADYLLPDPVSDGAGGLMSFGGRRISRDLVEMIVKAARATDSDPALLMAIADKESSFRPEVGASTSSAVGLFQFIETTWLKVVRDFGARHGLEKEAKAIVWSDDELVVASAAERARILDLRREPYLAALLAAEMLKRDTGKIGSRIGRNLTSGETYLAHFLGPDDAERFLDKVVREPKAAAARLLPKPARANRPIFFAGRGRKVRSLSVAEVNAKFERMMASRLDRYRDVAAMSTRVAEGPVSTGSLD